MDQDYHYEDYHEDYHEDYYEDCHEDYYDNYHDIYSKDYYEVYSDDSANQADHEELAQQLGVTIHGPGSESPLREGEEGANSPVGAAPPIPDGKPCKW